VRNIVKLGTRFSKAMAATYLDEHGQSQSKTRRYLQLCHGDGQS